MIENADRPVPEQPSDNENVWLTAAIVAFLVACVAFGFAALWTFDATGQEAVYRAQSFGPFGIALGAIVSFFTVIWRGVISTKQLNIQAGQLKQQTDQLSQIIRQNDAKEDETLVKLLQEGAKFITEHEKEAQVMAGVASLDVLISNDHKKRYSAQAMDILAGYYARNYAADLDSTRSARRAINRAATMGVRSTVKASFVPVSSSDRYEWPAVRGFAEQNYTGGSFYRSELDAIWEELGEMESVEFRYCNVRRGAYRNCRFRMCDIHAFDVDYLQSNTFIRCDFSGCNFDEVIAFEEIESIDLRPGDNYFRLGNPPRSSRFNRWEEILVAKAAVDEEVPF